MQRTGKTGRSGAGGSREQTDGAARVWCWGARCQLWGWEDGDGVRGEGFLPPFPLLVSHEGFWQSPQKGVAAPGSHVVLQNLGGRGAWWAGSLPHQVLPYLFTCVTPPTCSLGWILKCTAFTPMTSTWLQLHGGPGGGGILVYRKLPLAEVLHGEQDGAHTNTWDVHGYCPTLVSGVPLPPSWGCAEFSCKSF